MERGGSVSRGRGERTSKHASLVRHVFGPVPSRRLSRSLGVDPVPFKTCTFDCIYCQLGRTTQKTVERKEYVPCEVVVKELRDYLSNAPPFDFVTFSGSGEPTLNKALGKMISAVRELTEAQIAVLTNGSLLFDERVAEDLSGADVVLPSLDAASEEIFRRVNRPHESISLQKLVEGLKKFRKRFKGEIWVEVMLLSGENDGEEHLLALARLLREVNAEKVQLNTPVRPSPAGCAALSESELERALKLFLEEGVPAEIIPNVPSIPNASAFSTTDAFTAKEQVRGVRGVRGVEWERKKSEVQALLSRRPCTVEEISTSLGLNASEVAKYLRILESEGKLRMRKHGERTFFAVIR
ncbi:MAG: radical SAM protein [Methanophagales archaeon]|nr:radical SAM protein [Methanophagales archaeon]